MILENGMFDCEKCDKTSSEIECLKILKVAFTIVGINERFDLTTSKETIEGINLADSRADAFLMYDKKYVKITT